MRWGTVGIIAATLLVACVVPRDDQPGPDAAGPSALDDNAPPTVGDPFFSTARVEEAETMGVDSHGDLWVSCWSDDDALYVANGDGKGFGLQQSDDIVVNKVTGSPDTNDLAGEVLSHGDQVSSIWTTPWRSAPIGRVGYYNRKPTGMVCVDHKIYLAVQDLAAPDTMDAPAATIVRSDDHGVTWHWDERAPMFSDHIFTTIFFADFGKDSEHAIDGYVYAYGLDQNWRFSTRVESPTKLWLARVPKRWIQTRSMWEFFAGNGKNGRPMWSSDIADRKPVLEDTTVIYQHPLDPNTSPSGVTALSQGSVVYDAPLGRYIYTSWTEYTFEFYEAPAPWGPWKKFLSQDFGVYPWSTTKHGGYGTTIPSKFISSSGRSMWVQSNTFSGGVINYHFSLRHLYVTPYTASSPTNDVSEDPISTIDAVPVATSLHHADVRLQAEDSWNGDAKTTDVWGWAWPQTYRFNKVVYTTGDIASDGGWFTDLRVQVRSHGVWADVASQIVPPYPFDASVGAHQSFTMQLDVNGVIGDGVRIIGTPGGSAHYTSIGGLAAFDAP